MSSSYPMGNCVSPIFQLFSLCLSKAMEACTYFPSIQALTSRSTLFPNWIKGSLGWRGGKMGE